MYKRVASVFLVAMLTASLSGCDMPKKPGSEPPAGTSAVNEVKLPDKPRMDLSISNEVAAKIYIDSTYSMAGYVKPQGSTVYIDAVKGIETTISSTWKKDTIDFYKFGAADYSIPKLSREQFLNSNQVGFYNTTETAEETVVNQFDMGKLNIIVTDLFQTNQHLESLTRSLKNKCFSDDSKGLAIIGLKSQFEGRIYDIGRELKSVDYKSDNANPNTYRPFYLIVAGKAEDVRAFTVSYNERFKDAKVVMFLKNLGSPNSLVAEGYNNAPAAKEEKVDLMGKLDDVNGELNYQYNIKNNGTNGKANVVIFSGNSFNGVKNYTLNSDKKEFLSGKILGVIPQGKDTAIRLDLRVNPVGINYQKGQYRENFSLLADEKEYLKATDVFADWNIDDNAAIKNLKSVGGKSLNISKLTYDLANFSYKFYKPGIYDLKVNILAK